MDNDSTASDPDAFNRRSTDREEFTKEDVNSLSKDLKDLRTDIIKEQHRVRLKFIAIVAAFVAVIVLISYQFVISTRLSDIANSNQKILTSIEDCVNTSGKCYERGQQAQSQAVALIGVLTISAIDCTQKHPNDLAAAKQCIADETGITLPAGLTSK